MSDRSLLLVHAHPDDETINNGATMAKYVSEGVRVTLVTCTRGEEGEVLIPELAELASSHKDELGTHRETELADAMAALGSQLRLRFAQSRELIAFDKGDFHE